MSLASDSYVDWFLLWNDWEELEAFANYPTYTSQPQASIRENRKISQACLEETRKIQLNCEKNKNAKKNLNLAIGRWVRSKKSKTDTDTLIDLRISLEALYEIGTASEKAFRIATRGAWHLGENVEERIKIHDILRKAYDDSSRVIHGGNLKHTAKDGSLVSFAQDICRRGILKRLVETEIPKWNEIILGNVEKIPFS